MSTRASASKWSRRIRAGIDLAAAAGLRDVAVVGLHDDRFGPYELDEILEHGGQHGIHVVSRDRVDPQTTARHVWTGLAVARSMGLELGKYGLVPLTFEDQKQVVARIQYWFPHWSRGSGVLRRLPTGHGDASLPRAEPWRRRPQMAGDGREARRPRRADRHGEEVGGPPAAQRLPER